MIIGKFAVSPIHVSVGSRRFDPDTGMTEVTIYLDDDSVLPQWVSKAADADAYMKMIDECINRATEAEIMAIETNE